MEKIYRDADVDLSILKGKTMAVIGYGIQGKVQAANARDSGCTVIVGTRPPEASGSRAQAQADGFPAFSVAEATRKADILLIELADPAQPAVYKTRHRPPPARPARRFASATGSTCSTARSARRRREHRALRPQRARRIRAGEIPEG